jgi:hypothetical protein
MPCASRLFLALTAVFFAGAARAERLFIGVLEADGYQTVLFGASAFSRVADLPLAMDLVNSALNDSFLLPSFSCISPSETFRVVQTVDPTKPRGEDNPANVAILPILGNDVSVRKVFEDAYAVRKDSPPFTWYEQPKNTNHAPRVAIATSGRHLMTAVSLDALQWAWDNRAKLVDAPPQTIPGAVRILVNPQRFADLLGARSEQAATVFNFDKMLRDFDTFSFSLTLDGQAVSLTARGKPKAGSSLETLVKALRPPLPKLWNGVPDEAFFASVSACDSPSAWEAFLGKSSSRLLRPESDLFSPEAVSGAQLSYLVTTADKRGLCWVRIEPVKKEEPVKEAIRRLHTAKADDGILLVPEPARRKGDLQIETYALKFPQPASGAQNQARPAEPSTLQTLMTLFLKQAVLEAAVADGHLVMVLGLPRSIDEQLDGLKFQDKALPLHRKIMAQDPALSENICQGSALQPAALLRQIVMIMPGVKPEHLRAFPLGGDGVTFGISQGGDRTLTASLRLQSSEIAALQKINRDGREVLQELVFQLFSNQMLNLQEAGKEATGKAP